MEHSPPIGQPPRLLLQGGGGPGFKLSPFEIITLFVLLLFGAFIAYNVYSRVTNLNKKPPVANTYIPAFRTTLTSTVSSTGTVSDTQQVSLNFDIGQGTGKIQQFFVGLGDHVTQGQPLAKIDDSDLQKSLTSAKSNLSAAQSKLAVALNPTVATQAQSQQTINQAQSSLASAQSQLTTAQNNLQRLLNPLPGDIATAQQAVTQAQGSITQAQQAIVTAQNNVVNAQNDVTTAQISLQSSYSSMATSYSNVQASGCAQYAAPPPPQGGLAAVPAPIPTYGFPPQPAPTPAMGIVPTVPFGAATQLYNPNCSTSIGSYTGTVNSYNGNLATLTSKQNTLTQSQQTVSSGSLQQSVNSAQAGLLAAQAKLQQLQNPQQSDIDNDNAALASAQAGLASAQGGVTSAQAQNTQLLSPTPDVILPLQATVDQGTANVQTAQKNLDAATITAPFDGVISQVTGAVGTEVTAATTVFILLDPNLIRIDASVDQADVSNLKVGQPANITFDALTGRVYNGTITAIGLTPTIQQGVVTYDVTIGIDTSRLAAGVPVPAPGMTATITVVTSQTTNALVVPTRAVRRVGVRATVTVQTPTGDEVRTVTTGASSNTLTQVTGGLADGDEVLISSAATAQSRGPQPGGITAPPGLGGR